MTLRSLLLNAARLYLVVLVFLNAAEGGTPALAQTAATNVLDHSVAPDSVDYAMWARQAWSHALRGFTLTTLDINEAGSHPDTIGDHSIRFWLAKSDGHIVLAGNHPLSGEGDSIAMEFDSAGHPLSETRFARGSSISIERWKYDEKGRLIRLWYEFADDGWHSPEEFFYDENGTLARVELRNPDGSLQGNHFFHHRSQGNSTTPSEVVEYDTSYAHGRGLLTAVQLTAFDSEGRVERYQYRSVGLDRTIRIPFGFLNVYHDTTHGYSMEQYALAEGPHSEEASPTMRVSFSDIPSRWVIYDSSRREEQRTSLDSLGGKLIANSRYLPDERYLSSDLRSNRAPIQSITCRYTPQGLIESIQTRDLRNGWMRVLQFTYIYSSMGP